MSNSDCDGRLDLVGDLTNQPHLRQDVFDLIFEILSFRFICYHPLAKELMYFLKDRLLAIPIELSLLKQLPFMVLFLFLIGTTLSTLS